MMTCAMGFHLMQCHLSCGTEPMNAWTPVPVSVLAREQVAAVFPVASSNHGVTWTHAKAWGRLTPARAAVIYEPTCGGFCDDSRESVIVIVSEIAHQIQRAW